MLKKMMLLAMAVGALVAFAAPAASAHQWTYEEGTIPNGNKVSEEYEGFLSFTTPPPAVPVHSTFGCDVTTIIQVTGTADGTGSGKVTAFNPTTSTCKGTGIFTGCKLTHDTSNPPWNVDINATKAATEESPHVPGDLTVTGPVTITNVYESPPCAVAGSELTFNSVTATTTNGEVGVEEISISSTATNGFTVASGSVKAETGGLLGVDY